MENKQTHTRVRIVFFFFLFFFFFFLTLFLFFPLFLFFLLLLFFASGEAPQNDDAACLERVRRSCSHEASRGRQLPRRRLSTIFLEALCVLVLLVLLVLLLLPLLLPAGGAAVC